MPGQLHLWPQHRVAHGLSWSVSRARRLQDCPRKYYLYHHGAQGGGAADAPAEARELFILRSLKNRFMWVGEVVHELIELALTHWSRGSGVSLEGLIDRGTRRMRAQYAESLQKLYRERPRRACGLFEHEYALGLGREEWRRQRDRMELCLRNFYQLPLLEEIQDLPRWRWLALESGGSFELDGAQVTVKPDFAFRDAAGRVVLVDWKTGKARPEDEHLQLSIYGIYAKRSWGSGGAPLQARAVHLEDASVTEYCLDNADLQAAEEMIRESLAEMRRLGEGGTGAPELSAFPKTDDTSRCTYCAFRRVCGR